MKCVCNNDLMWNTPVDVQLRKLFLYHTGMVYEGVMTNLSRYIADHPYPPTIAEIAAYPKKENEELSRDD